MERTRALSIKYVKGYKFLLMSLLTSAVITYAIFSISSGDWLGILIGITYPVLLVVYWYPKMKESIDRIKELAYDDENLYVQEEGYEIQIPFYQVRDIEIMSFDGLYKFKLYHHDQFGKEVICKPSLWYPLNFKRVDAELNRIRSLVRKAHRGYKEQIGVGNALPSN